MTLLPVKPAVEPPIQASKWLTCPVLLDVDEMYALLDSLGDFWIFPISGILPKGQSETSKAQFIEEYRSYIEPLKNGRLPDEKLFRTTFSSAFTASLEALYIVYLSEKEQLIKIGKPVIQLQHHKFTFSHIDGKFRSMVYGANSIFWGLQFSYPQLYQDARILEVKQVIDSAEFPNTALFKTLQRWVRHNTIPTPFLADGKQVNVPIRLGKQCLPWINNHPQLASSGLSVAIN